MQHVRSSYFYSIFMLVAFLTLAANALAQTTATAPGKAEPTSNLKLEKNGVFTIGGIKFTVTHKSEAWAPAWQHDLVPDPGFPKVTDQTHEVQAAFKTGSGKYQLSQMLKFPDPRTATYSASLQGTPTGKTNSLCLSVNLPVATYRGQKIFFDQTACDLPWWNKGMSLPHPNQVQTIRLPLQTGGTLVIQGPVTINAQDNRTFGSEYYDLQLYFTPYQGTITEAKLQLTMQVIPASDTLAIAYNPDAKKPSRPKAAPAKPQQVEQDPAFIAATLAKVKPLAALRPQGENFVGPDGRAVRFWGMNLVAFYPDYALADKTAENLAGLGVNIVRPHHNLRPSADWNPADCHSLLTYQGDSRTPNLKAWDRFDYLNAKLREKGIYLALSLHGTRNYTPEDGAILKVSAQDDEEWADAMEELNQWHWQKAFDPRKMLPVFDERAFQLNAEFARYLLTHVNPYTGLTYGQDPQVLTLELVNEFSTEYTLICGNVFPPYWTKKLNQLLHDYAQKHGVETFDLYKAKTPAQKKCFADFCNELDENYTRRMEKVIREAGCKASIEFSNLWRGDGNLRFRAKTDAVIEDHGYFDPLVVNDPNTFANYPSQLSGKPFILGELNQSENPKLIAERQPVRSMLPFATAAYGSLHNWSGVIWFAWCHGGRSIGADGWGKKLASRAVSIGDLAGDGVMLDHLRTAGIIYKNQYLQASVAPQTINVDDSYFASDYASLMSGQSPCKPGWQGVYAFRKVFGPLPPGQKDAPWAKASPVNPTISDTAQIVRDATRKQLTFAAPKAEGFSGYLDGKPPANLSLLHIAGDSGFATILVTTLDDTPLTKSHHLLLSRTFTDAAGAESASGGQVLLQGLLPGNWRMKITRSLNPTSEPLPLTPQQGVWTLPATSWYECELILQEAGK